jgi:hypothetical protein
MTKAIVASPTTKLTRLQVQQLSTYTDPGIILNSLARKGWNIDKAIDKLVDIIDDTDTKVSTQLAAIKYLNQMIIDAMERSGMMVMATKTIRGEDGEEVTFTGHMVQSQLQGPSSPQTTLADLTGKDYPDKEDKDVTQEPKQTTPRKGKSKTAKPGRSKSTDGSGGQPEQSSEDTADTADTRQAGRHTEAGLSDDLHFSKYPEIHIKSFQGLAVPPESKIPGPADFPDSGDTGDTAE